MSVLNVPAVQPLAGSDQPSPLVIFKSLQNSDYKIPGKKENTSLYSTKKSDIQNMI